MRVYLFRGLAGAIFSTGMDRLSEELEQAGHETSVHSWLERTGVQAEAIAQHNSGELTANVAVIGHSLGGNSANFMGRALADAGVPVAYIATVDPTEPRPNPAGVRSDNFRSSDMRAEKVEGANDIFRPDLNHIQIDKDERVHRRILEICAAVAPAKVSAGTGTPNAAGTKMNVPPISPADDDAQLKLLLERLLANKDGMPNDIDDIIRDMLPLFGGTAGAQASGANPPDPKELPVNFAMGTKIGNLLNGRKTGIGIAGLLATTVLPVLFPQLAPIKAVLEALDLGGDLVKNPEPGKNILMPVFAALSSWGVLGKFEKWAKLLKSK